MTDHGVQPHPSRDAHRCAIVTGAARGIGAAIARRLATDGFGLVLNDRDGSRLNTTVESLRADGAHVVGVTGDVTIGSTNDGLVAAAVEHFGGLDVMVTNAGIVQVISIDELDRPALESIFAVNVYATIFGIQSAARQMRVQGGGKIITCASVAGHAGSAFMASYCASKAAVISTTQAAARELAPYGITVNAYCPGAVGTDMWTELEDRLNGYAPRDGGGAADAFVASIPLGRMQTPQDVAGVVSFLAGPDSDYMTGQSVVVDGGVYMQ